jgi:ABC-type transport system involved in multi-copper enzyme maturation permease subunit
MRNFIVIAGYEFALLLKNRWLYGFTILFALLSISLFFVLTGVYHDWQAGGIDRLSANLYNLVVLLSSLMGIMFSSLSFVGDRSDKTADLLRSYPVSIFQYLSGKYSGLLLAQSLSLAAGFCPVLIISIVFSGNAFLKGFAASLFSGIALSAIYSAWGMLIGSIVRSRLNALAASLIVWFFSIFIYEILIWAFLPCLPYFLEKFSLALLLGLNPAEAVRIGSVFAQGEGVVYGSEFYGWQKYFQSSAGIITGSAIMAAHLSFPIFLSYSRAKRRT